MVWKGSIKAQGKLIKKGEALFFKKDVDQERLVQIEGIENSGFIWVAGMPINEFIVRYGPFIVNEVHELSQAIEDF